MAFLRMNAKEDVVGETNSHVLGSSDTASESPHVDLGTRVHLGRQVKLSLPSACLEGTAPVPRKHLNKHYAND